MAERGIIAEQLTYQHIRQYAVDTSICAAVGHYHLQILFDALYLNGFAGNDDYLGYKMIVVAYLFHQITLVTLYILVVLHQIDHDRMLVDNGFRSVAETQETIELAYYTAVGKFLQLKVTLLCNTFHRTGA